MPAEFDEYFRNITSPLGNYFLVKTPNTSMETFVKNRVKDSLFFIVMFHLNLFANISWVVAFSMMPATFGLMDEFQIPPLATDFNSHSDTLNLQAEHWSNVTCCCFSGHS
jgi:hypothetical protein